MDKFMEIMDKVASKFGEIVEGMLGKLIGESTKQAENTENTEGAKNVEKVANTENNQTNQTNQTN